jgi:DnaJ-class molecular chaperone
MSKINPYEILGVSKTDDTQTIEKKFKKLAVKYHPDKNKDPGAVKIYENISLAKDILTDPEKKARYDKYGITNDNDIVNNEKYQEMMFQENMIKNRCNLNCKFNVSINEVLNGFTKDLNINNEVIKLVFDKSDPVNKKFIFKNKGRKHGNICGDLIIELDIKPDNIFQINKSNNNLVISHKISLAQSLCGFELSIPIGKNKPIIIQHDSIVKPGTVYCVKNMGLNIMDDSESITKSDIEIHFDIDYNINPEMIEKLKNVFNYNYTKSNKLLNPDIHLIEEYKEEINEHQGFESMFQGGIPGFGIPMGAMGGQPQECRQS